MIVCAPQFNEYGVPVILGTTTTGDNSIRSDRLVEGVKMLPEEAGVLLRMIERRTFRIERMSIDRTTFPCLVLWQPDDVDFFANWSARYYG